jgi:hypothetical protein
MVIQAFALAGLAVRATPATDKTKPPIWTRVAYVRNNTKFAKKIAIGIPTCSIEALMAEV